MSSIVSSSTQVGALLDRALARLQAGRRSGAALVKQVETHSARPERHEALCREPDEAPTAYAW